MRARLGLIAVGTVALVAASVARADEIVYFANGAEMPVRAHSMEKDKDMVKLDLGGNSFISFPLSMVDKIADAGNTVFLNPAYHPANQAVEGSHFNPVPVQDLTSRNSGGDIGYRVRQGAGGTDGNELGEPTIGSGGANYSKSASGVPVVSVSHSRGLISHVAKPSIDMSGPTPQVGQATIQPTAMSNRAKPMILKPREQQAAPPADAPGDTAPPPPPAAESDDSPGQP